MSTLALQEGSLKHLASFLLTPIDVFRTCFELEDASYDFVLYPHTHADGDALGSCLALALFLEARGFRVLILGSEEAPAKLSTCLGEDFQRLYRFTEEEQNKILHSEHFALRLDCSHMLRLGERKVIYERRRNVGKALTIDHHLPNEKEAEELEELSYRDAEAAATCEILALFFQEVEKQTQKNFLTETISRALLLGMMTDTGRFSYSNVRSKTHAAASYICEQAGTMAPIVSQLFEEKTLAQFKIRGYIYSHTEFFCQQRLAVAHLTSPVYHAFSCDLESLEGLSAEMRGVEGVEMAVFVRWFSNGSLKASVRSSENFEASTLANHFSGGGHLRAAGFSLPAEFFEGLRVEEAQERLNKELILLFEKQEKAKEKKLKCN